MSKRTKLTFFVPIAVCLIILSSLAGFYYTRLQTVHSIKKLSDYDDYNLYRMDIKYSYDLDRMIERGMDNDERFAKTMFGEVLPMIPIKFNVPKYGCSAFTVKTKNNQVMMGRSYDFRYDTSPMLVYCAPKDGYKSVAFAALDNINHTNKPESFKEKLECLAAPFVCLDGVNEKGVSIAVLALSSKPTIQNSGKPTISTTFAIRLVLDRAATSEEAVELLKKYDMRSSSGRDNHFYITDAKGDGRVVEYDCDDPERRLVATPTEAVTNFYIMYKYKVDPVNKNMYGTGMNRYEAIEKVLDDNEGHYTKDTVWEALIAAAQKPNPKVLTSNTQWSVAYNNTEGTAEICLRRKWNDKWFYKLESNEIKAE